MVIPKLRICTIQDSSRKETELFSTPLDLDVPLLMFFEDKEEFRILSQSAKITETDDQIMDMALKTGSR